MSSDAVPIIAPLWADYNFRIYGSIYYRVTTDPHTLARAKELIAGSNPVSFSEFWPTRGIVVTWSDAILLSRTLDAFEVK